jgi:hypothetical protein
MGGLTSGTVCRDAAEDDREGGIRIGGTDEDEDEDDDEGKVKGEDDTAGTGDAQVGEGKGVILTSL